MKLHLLFAVCLLAPACSDSGGNSVDASDDGMIGCKTDPLAQVYTANMTQMGPNHITFMLVSGNPAPPAKYNNTWTIKLLDGAGHPVTDATMTAMPFMPRHGHGTSIVPTVTNNGDGTYGVGILYFFMAGLWQVTLQVTQSSAGADTGIFSFCVEG